MFILAANSLHHALGTLTPVKKTVKSEVFSIPGLSLNCNSKNLKKIVQNLLIDELQSIQGSQQSITRHVIIVALEVGQIGDDRQF